MRSSLKSGAEELIAKFESNRVLGDLARTPFILAAMKSIFEAGRALPTTRVGILQASIQLLEEMVEHSNELRRAPLSNNATVYLSELAIGMTARGDVSSSEKEARAICGSVSRRLADEKQMLQTPEPAYILNALSAHHVLERIDYPRYRFALDISSFKSSIQHCGWNVSSPPLWNPTTGPQSLYAAT